MPSRSIWQQRHPEKKTVKPFLVSPQSYASILECATSLLHCVAAEGAQINIGRFWATIFANKRTKRLLGCIVPTPGKFFAGSSALGGAIELAKGERFKDSGDVDA